MKGVIIIIDHMELHVLEALLCRNCRTVRWLNLVITSSGQMFQLVVFQLFNFFSYS